MPEPAVWLLIALALAAGYWWGRRVGLALAAWRARGVGPDILVTVCKAGAPPQAWRVARGDVLKMRSPDGTILVGFAKTRPLPTEVGAMLEELGK